MQSGEHAPLPNSPERAATSALRTWCLRVGDRLPFLKSVGFALWIGWFGVAYSTTAWVSDDASTVSALGIMFTTSTISHMVGLVAFALAALRFPGFATKRSLIVGSGLIAGIGCFIVALSSPDYGSPVPFGLFLVGCAFTGLGTAALGINSGLMLCVLKPGHALCTILIAELIASAIQLMVSGVDPLFGRIIFVTLPIGSAFCFAINSFATTPETARESSRLRPNGVFGRFLIAVFVLSIAANLGRGLYSSVASPAVLAFDGTAISFVFIAIIVVLLVIFAGARTTPNFARLFYPTACLIMLSLLVMYLLPEDLSLGLVTSSIAYQVFDMVMWYAFAYIVFESKVSAIVVVALGRAVIAGGVTAGNLLGENCVAANGSLASWAPMLFIALFTVVLGAFLLFPERHINRLLLPIPDEDLQFEVPTQETGCGEASSLSAHGADNVASQSPAKEVASHDVSDDNEIEHTTLVAVSDVSNKKDEAHPLESSIGKPGPWKTRALTLADEAGLTGREKEVFLMLARGRGSQSISDALTISLYTTRAHTRNIYTKLDIHSRQELIDKVNSVCF